MSSAAVELRAAQRSDLDPVADLMLALAEQGQRADRRFAPAPAARDVFRQDASERWFGRFMPFPACWLALVNGHVVGMVAGSPVPTHPAFAVAPTARIEHLWVEPAHRRNGTGRALVQRWTEAAKAAGFERVEVSTLAADARAIGFWTSVGFGPWMVSLVR